MHSSHSVSVILCPYTLACASRVMETAPQKEIGMSSQQDAQNADKTGGNPMAGLESLQTKELVPPSQDCWGEFGCFLGSGSCARWEPICPVSPATRTTTWQFLWQSWALWLRGSLPQELRLPASVCWQVTWPWQGHSRALGLHVLWLLAWLNSMARWWMCLARICTLKLGTVEAFQLWTAPVTWAKRRGLRACLGIAQVSGLSWALVLCRVVEACAAAPSRCFMPQDGGVCDEMNRKRTERCNEQLCPVDCDHRPLGLNPWEHNPSSKSPLKF